MRVRCSSISGHDVEGEVIGGEKFDPITGECDLESEFTVRCDDGTVFQVHGWLVDIEIIEPRKPVVM